MGKRKEIPIKYDKHRHKSVNVDHDNNNSKALFENYNHLAWLNTIWRLHALKGGFFISNKGRGFVLGYF